MKSELYPPRMYILIRNDLASMTPGRACAQASHAANECIGNVKEDNRLSDLLKTWEDETGTYFGTTIVLSASNRQIIEISDKLDISLESENLSEISYGITFDPEYAVRDGETVHLIPLNTCMWIFGRVDDVKPYIEHLNLY